MRAWLAVSFAGETAYRIDQIQINAGVMALLKWKLCPPLAYRWRQPLKVAFCASSSGPWLARRGHEVTTGIVSG